MANKIDLVQEGKAKLAVTSEQIKEFAEREKVIYLGECSAATDLNIKESVEALMVAVHEV